MNVYVVSLDRDAADYAQSHHDSWLNRIEGVYATREAAAWRLKAAGFEEVEEGCFSRWADLGDREETVNAYVSEWEVRR